MRRAHFIADIPAVHVVAAAIGARSYSLQREKMRGAHFPLVPTLFVGTHVGDALRRVLSSCGTGRRAAGLAFPRGAWERGCFRWQHENRNGSFQITRLQTSFERLSA